MGARNFSCDRYRVRETGEFTPNPKWSGNQPNPKISDALDSISRADSESGTPSDSCVPGSSKIVNLTISTRKKKHRTREGVCTPQITGMVCCAGKNYRASRKQNPTISLSTPPNLANRKTQTKNTYTNKRREHNKQETSNQ